MIREVNFYLINSPSSFVFEEIFSDGEFGDVDEPFYEKFYYQSDNDGEGDIDIDYFEIKYEKNRFEVVAENYEDPSLTGEKKDNESDKLPENQK